MKTLVIGCTGTVGSYVVPGLMDKGVKVRCMTRSPEKIKGVPENFEVAIADLDRPETLGPAFSAVNNVFIAVPVNPNETAQGLTAVEAAKIAGVKKIVYMSVYMPRGSDIIPHFKSKIPIEDAVKESGIAYTILRPNNFFQNDRSIISIITAYGIYPAPLGSMGVDRIDARDVADCAVNALTEPGHDGETYSLHGPDLLTGNDMARIYSKYAGRDVRYAGNDLDVWVRHVKNVMPEWLYRDNRIMYKFFQDHGMVASKGDLDKQLKLLGHQPRSFEDFAQELAEEWKSSLVSAA